MSTRHSSRGFTLLEILVAMVILADLALLVLFSMLRQITREVFDAGASDVNVIARFAWEVGGAVVVARAAITLSLA